MQSTSYTRDPLLSRNGTDLDFFDVGQSIGDLILQRCQLEDAFFISSLLEAPLEQLRARGFPVDRILTPVPPPEPPKPNPKPPVSEAKSNGAEDAEKTTPRAQKENRSTTTEKNAVSSGVSSGSQAPDEEASKPAGGGTDAVLPPGEIMNMVREMFPDADEEFLKREMGSSPSLDQVRRLAERMASGDYPRKSQQQSDATEPQKPDPVAAASRQPDRATEQSSLLGHSNAEASVPKKGKSNVLKKGLKNAFGGFRRSSQSTSAGSGGAPQSGPATVSSTESNDTGPVPPQHDAAAHSNMEQMLENAVTKSAAVDAKGVKSNDSLLTSVPKELDRGNTCEIVPGQSLKPFAGPRGDGRTHNGIQVFTARNSVESEAFLQVNEDAIEKFALVIRRLAGVYDVNLKAVALFHDPCGGTIAFNSNRSLHFNLRFFHALHYLQNKHESYDCYSYWMVVFAHELSHNLVSGHNKEHGFYTESYIAKYLPKFLALVSTLPKNF